MAKSSRNQSSENKRRRNQARKEKRKHRRVRARAVIPGRRYKITRRCLERRFFLTPDSPEVRELLGFILAWCLEEYGLHLHAACFMGNHYHLDVTDVRGNFPSFKCKLNSLIAKALNAKRGRFDRFWSGDSPCDVELVSDDDDILFQDNICQGFKLVPFIGCASGIAWVVQDESPDRWPGLTTAGLAFGTKLRFRRPDGYFDKRNSKVPEVAELVVVRPDVMPERSDAELLALLDKKVRDIELEVCEKLRKNNRRFLGESRILKQHWNHHPRTREARFGIRPKVAASNKWARIAALQRNEAWEAEYAEAYEAHRRGEPFVFPYGCWAARLFHGATVAPPPG